MAGQEVAELFATLRLQVDNAAFNGARRAFDGISDFLVDMRNNVLGAFAISSITEFTRETLAALPAIGDVARKAGITTDALQELRFAFNNSGAEQSELDAGLVKLNRNMAEAVKGNKDMAATFSKLGVKIKDADGKVRPASDAFLDIADGIAKLKDPATQAEVAMTLLGSAGPSLVQGLEQGKDGIIALTAEARRLGLAIDKETIDKAGEADDVLNNLSAVIKTGFMAVVAESADVIKEFGKAFIEVTVVLRKSIKLFKENSKVVKFLALAIGTYLVLSFAQAQIGVVQLAFKFITSMISMNIATVGVVGSLKLLATALSTAFISAIKLATPFIAIAGLVALIVLVFDDIYTYLKGGDSLIGTLTGRWNEFAEKLFKDASEDDFWLTKILKYVLGVISLVMSQIDKLFNDSFKRLNVIMEMYDSLSGLFDSSSFSDAFKKIKGAGDIGLNYIRESDDALLMPAQGLLYAGEKIMQGREKYMQSKNLTMNSPVTVNMNGTFNGEPADVAKQVSTQINRSQTDIARASLDTLAAPYNSDR